MAHHGVTLQGQCGASFPRGVACSHATVLRCEGEQVDQFEVLDEEAHQDSPVLGQSMKRLLSIIRIMSNSSARSCGNVLNAASMSASNRTSTGTSDSQCRGCGRGGPQMEHISRIADIH